MQSDKAIRKLAYVGVLSSLAIVMGYLEQMIPLPVSFPGVKLGLSNICVILALYRLGYREAFSVSLIKSLICGILFWGVGGMLYGVAGALLSFMVMAFVYKTRLLGTVGIS
ncbi:MAG: Gx transporter family protein, partial [Clostridia bacterium]|nr:Gx transporter family protein [Clostridia bacterium]